MTLRVHSRLLVIAFTLIAALWIGAGVMLSRRVADYVGDATERELRRHAAATASALTHSPLEHVGPVREELAENTATKITVFDIDGTPIVFDDHAEAIALNEVVLAAATNASGEASVRTEDWQVVALRFSRGTHPWVVRVSRPRTASKDAVQKVWWVLAIAAALALILALFMTALSAYLTTAGLRRIAVQARAIAKRAGEQRAAGASADELDDLSGSLARISDDIGRTVAALARERALLEAVLEGMDTAVLALDENGCITLSNRAAMAILEVESPPTGQSLIEFLRIPELIKLLDGKIEPATIEFELPGPHRRLVARITPLRDGRGCVLALNDITDMRRLENVRRDFVANVSHELRTPVTIIRANAETLMDGAMNDPVHGIRLLDGLHRNAERLSRIISDLLDIARIEAGRYEIAVEQVDAEQAVLQAVETVERAAQGKQIECKVDIHGPLMLRADAKALDQVLVNLLDNAIKYTPPGSQVTIGAEPTTEGARIFVADNGPGIAASHRERIFERFYRVDPGRSRDMGGTGLGLSIVKHLVEAMGGSVGVAPRDPHGTEFWLKIPTA